MYAHTYCHIMSSNKFQINYKIFNGPQFSQKGLAVGKSGPMWFITLPNGTSPAHGLCPTSCRKNGVQSVKTS